MASDLELMSSNDSGTNGEQNPYIVSFFFYFHFILKTSFLRKFLCNNFRSIITKFKMYVTKDIGEKNIFG